VKVRLERDLSNPMWSEGFRPHLYAEVVGGAMLSPINGMGGGADKACSNGDCSKKPFPLGFIVGARGGYQFIKGFSVEIGLGFMYMSEKMTRKNVVATADHGSLTSDNYKDQTTVAGGFAEISAAYSLLDKTPVTFRVGGGAARLKATFKNGGDFTGDITQDLSKVCGNDKACLKNADTTTVSTHLQVPEQAPFVIVPFVAPEVRIGYRVSKKVVVDFGVAMFIMLAPPTERQPASSGNAGGFNLRNDQGRRASIGTVTFKNDPKEQNGGLATLPREDGLGVMFALVPTLSGHFDFW
jgi:hypothetical protein